MGVVKRYVRRRSNSRVVEMIIVNNINAPLDTDFEALAKIAARALKIPENDIISALLYRKSVDARRKSDVHFCISLVVECKNESKVLKKNKNAALFAEKEYIWQKAQSDIRPVVVGFGPAGMFAALTLARAGLRPIVLERGRDVDSRTRDVQSFFDGGTLNPESNVQFGEGGAGTFSDGKLNTGIKDVRCRTVLLEFVRFGAPQDILIDAKPHIGTDILKNVVKNLREEIKALGGEIRFESRLQDIEIKDNTLCSITVNGEKIPCNALLLCIGHSARDTFLMLKDSGVSMERKPFAMGVRIEHLQSDINRALYGDFAEHPALGAADYKLVVRPQNGRGVYTFCMCPGGEVVNASSEQAGIAVNGMSEIARAGKNANSALLVGVEPSDLSGDDVLEGCYLQREIEQNAYKIGGGAVPVTTVGHFLRGEEPRISRVKPTVRPSYAFCELEDIYPNFITESLKQGIALMNDKISGFSDSSAVITAPETRSSSPVRILRGESGESQNIRGIYPCGEGAGYAGGIMSAAVDGIKSAEKLIENIGGYST